MEDRDLTKLHKHIRNAWIAGCISASITLLVSVLSIFFPDITKTTGIDAWSIVDAVLVAGLSYGIYRESRSCATALLVYFAVAKIIMAIDTEQFQGVAQGLVFIYFFFQGTVATFQLRKYKVETGVIRETSHRTLYAVLAGLGTLLGAAFIFLVVVGTLGPEDEVIPGKQLKARFVREIQELGLLDKNEELAYFYSDAFYSIRNGLYFFTDRKVVLYNEDWEKATIIVPYGAIANIELVDGPDAEKRRINIYQRPDTVLTIPLPDKGTGYKQYYDLMVRNWKRNR